MPNQATNTAYNAFDGAASSLLGLPVDVGNLLLNGIGLGFNNPIGGSNWIGSHTGGDPTSTAWRLGSVVPSPISFGAPLFNAYSKAKGIGTLGSFVNERKKALLDSLNPQPIKTFSIDDNWQDVNTLPNIPNFNLKLADSLRSQ